MRRLKAGANDPVQLFPVEQPQYPALATEVQRTWREVKREFRQLREDWFEAVGLDDPAKAAKNEPFDLTTAQRSALDAAIEEFLRQFAGDDRSEEGFSNQDAEDGTLQQAEFLAYSVGQARGSELTGFEMNQALTRAQRESLLRDAFERMSRGGRLLFEERLGEIRDAMLDAFSRGDSPLAVARRLSRDLDGYLAGRLRTIVRTEMALSAEAASRDLYRQAGVTSLEVIGDPNTDAVCTAHIGKRYGLDDLDSLPIYHPNCFCSTIPVAEDQ